MSATGMSVRFSEIYRDAVFDYVNIRLPRPVVTRLLSPEEVYSFGVCMPPGWSHYELWSREPHVLLMRRLRYAKTIEVACQTEPLAPDAVDAVCQTDTVCKIEAESDSDADDDPEGAAVVAGSRCVAPDCAGGGQSPHRIEQPPDDITAAADRTLDTRTSRGIGYPNTPMQVHRRIRFGERG